MNKTNCTHCDGKGYFTMIYGKHYSADFIGDKSYTKKPTIHLIACPKCNKDNKLKLEGVVKNIYD